MSENLVLNSKSKAVIFDLDGVIVSTDNYHYLAWKALADKLKIPFDRKVNDRLRGVSRRESLEIILEQSGVVYSEDEIAVLLEEKNRIYREKLENLSQNDLLPGVKEVINLLKDKKIPIAIGSSSKNTPKILQLIGMDEVFDAVVDGNQITKSKPDPEVFLKAARQLQIEPKECLVVEDADAGIEAGISAGMKVLAVGAASDNKKATYSMENITIDFMHQLF